jgi:hypothetical protein
MESTGRITNMYDFDKALNRAQLRMDLETNMLAAEKGFSLRQLLESKSEDFIAGFWEGCAFMGKWEADFREIVDKAYQRLHEQI